MTFTPWFAALVLSSVQPNGLPHNALARLGAGPHRLGPVHVAVSADSKRIITVTPNGYARTFDAATGEPLAGRRLVEKAERNMYGVGGSLAGLSADGSLALAFDGEDYSARAIRLIDTATGKVKMKYPSQQGGNNWISSAVLSKDGKKILVNEYGNGNPRHVIVDTATGASKAFLEQNNGGFVSAAGLMHFSPDSSKVLILDANNFAPGAAMSGTCYNVEDGKKLWTEPVGMWPAFTADSKHLLAIGVEKLSGVRDAATGKEVKRTLPKAADATGQQTAGPKDLALFPQSAGGAVVWDVAAGKEVAKLAAGRAARNTLSGAAFAPDGTFVVTAFNGHLCRWNLPKGDRAFGDPEPPGSITTVSRLVFSPDGTKVFSLGESDAPGVWDLTAKTWARTPDPDKPKALTAAEQMNWFWGGYMQTRSVAYTAAGPRYLTGGGENVMEVRDGLTGKTLAKLKDNSKQANEYFYGQLAADGATATLYKMNYTGNQSKMTFETWDVASGAKTNFTEFTFPNYASLATLSPCGRFAMVGGKVVVVSSGSTLFNIVKNQNQNYYYYGGITTFSADGRLMATTQNEETLRGNISTPGTMHVWDVVTGTNVRKLSTGANSNVVAFSPDNRLIAFATQKGVKVFDLNSSKEIANYAVTDMRIPNYYEGMGAGSPLAFAPDGRALATGHFDGTVTVWKVPAPPELPEIKPDEADKFWDALGTEKAPGEDRTNLYRLAQRPEAAMRILNAKFVAPAPKPLDVDLPTLIRKLDAPAFYDRQAAVKKLKELGPRAAAALQDGIRTTESVEVRARCEELLDQMKAGPKTYPNGPDLRAARAIEILERIGSPDAKRLLTGWANQTANVRIANDAALALVRIAAAGK